MEFGIVSPGRMDAWKDVVLAEEHGFTHAWYYDSQMLYSDVYVCMALAAEHTKRIKLGTGVAVPSNRIDAVTAHSIASINQLAPGRAILGLGTGFTGRYAMGLPPLPMSRLRESIINCRKLLSGDEILFRDGKHERWIKFVHPNYGYINIKDRIPIVVAAHGPRVMQMTGELADGWFTLMADTDSFKKDLATVRSGATAVGRSLPNDFLTVALTTGCILRPGETATSPRVMQRVGPYAIVGLHAQWEHSPVAAPLPPEMVALANRYRDEYVSKMKTPANRRYRQVHEGHLIYLKPGEDRYIPENLIRGVTLTGTGAEIIARLKELEAAGLKQVALQIVNDGRALIEEFSREVIAKY